MASSIARSRYALRSAVSPSPDNVAQHSPQFGREGPYETLGLLVLDVVHSSQRGFPPGQRMSNAYDALVPIHLSSYRFNTVPAVVISGICDAFPSLRDVLSRVGAPSWLIVGIQALYAALAETLCSAAHPSRHSPGPPSVGNGMRARSIIGHSAKWETEENYRNKFASIGWARQYASLKLEMMGPFVAQQQAYGNLDGFPCHIADDPLV